MLGYKKGDTQQLCGQMPLHYPADRVTYVNTDSGLSATNTQDAIDEVAGRLNYASETVNGFIVIKYDKIVQLCMANGTINTDSSGYILDDNNARVTLATKYRPLSTTNLLDSYNKIRITVNTNGTITLPNNTNVSGYIIRFSAMWITA